MTGGHHRTFQQQQAFSQLSAIILLVFNGSTIFYGLFGSLFGTLSDRVLLALYVQFLTLTLPISP
ncbi:hypothetical protein ACT8ZS_12750 [Paenibacillus sp. M.A.Huq-84]